MRGKTREARLLMWKALRQWQIVTVRGLQAATNLPERTIYDYITALLKYGYLIQTREYRPTGPVGNCSEYRLIRDTGLYPPEIRAGQLVDANLSPDLRDNSSKLWAALRALRRFDCAQLAAITGQNYGAISRYLKFLKESGYLRVVEPNQSGKAGSWTIYQLVYDSGPLPPMRRRDGDLFDPNTVEIKVNATTTTNATKGNPAGYLSAL